MNVKTGTVMVAEDSGLGFAGVKDYNLFLWSWKAKDQGIAGWAQLKVIQLMTLLLVPKRYIKVSPRVTGFVEGTDTIFISTYDSIFTLKIKSGQVRKVARRWWDDGFSVPYMSFYAPGISVSLQNWTLQELAEYTSEKYPSISIAGWEQLRVIMLNTLLSLPEGAWVSSCGFMEGTDTIFISTSVSIFTLKLKSGQIRNVGPRSGYGPIVPYMNFYTR
ncbi:hypothetical protein EJB05_14188, partial [Eragrostis curvula]